MPDMLVKLYELPDLMPEVNRLAADGITIRRALAPEKHVVGEWIEGLFGSHWRSECEVSFARLPIACFIAVEGQKLLGFGCYDASAKGFFGPSGVDESARGKGVGKALLIACLHGMWMEGYVYAIIGAAGPVAFYEKAVGATVIEGSTPGIYKGLLGGIEVS
jgi:GNAT superfamily N-acetyltransferase